METAVFVMENAIRIFPSLSFFTEGRKDSFHFHTRSSSECLLWQHHSFERDMDWNEDLSEAEWVSEFTGMNKVNRATGCRDTDSWYSAFRTSHPVQDMQHKADYSNPFAYNINIQPPVSVCVQAAEATVSFQLWRDGRGPAVPWSCAQWEC